MDPFRATSLDEPFESERHHVDALNWLDLMQKVNRCPKFQVQSLFTYTKKTEAHIKTQ